MVCLPIPFPVGRSAPLFLVFVFGVIQGNADPPCHDRADLSPILDLDPALDLTLTLQIPLDEDLSLHLGFGILDHDRDNRRKSHRWRIDGHERTQHSCNSLLKELDLVHDPIAILGT